MLLNLSLKWVLSLLMASQASAPVGTLGEEVLERQLDLWTVLP